MQEFKRQIDTKGDIPNQRGLAAHEQAEVWAKREEKFWRGMQLRSCGGYVPKDACVYSNVYGNAECVPDMRQVRCKYMTAAGCCC